MMRNVEDDFHRFRSVYFRATKISEPAQPKSRNELDMTPEVSLPDEQQVRRA